MIGGFIGHAIGEAVVIVTAPAVQVRTNWDTSDPRFYDWWRKRAKDEREKLKVVQEEMAEATAPALRVETIAAVEAASSVREIQALDLLKYERDILKAAIAEYERMIAEDEEEAEFLLLH